MTIGLAQLAPMARGQAVPITSPARPDAINARDLFTIDSHLLRFWNSDGAPVAIVQYRLISPKRLDATHGPVVTATVALRQNGNAEQVHDTIWGQGLDRSADRPEDRFAAGFVVVPLAPWITSWSLDAGPSWSTTRQNGGVFPLQPLPSGSVVVSDLALGVPESADIWEFGGQGVLLGRWGAFNRKVPVHVSYQVLSEAAHDDVRTYITCTDITDPKVGKRVMQLSFDGRLDAGVNIAERIVDVSHLKAGRYQLEIQVGDLHGGGTSVRLATLVVR